MAKYNIVEAHKEEIKSGDLILFNGVVKTVCKNNIKRDSFMGLTIFGDNYKGGKLKVKKVINYKA